MSNDESAGAAEETERRRQGRACWLRLAFGVIGLFWVSVILYAASYLGFTA